MSDTETPIAPVDDAEATTAEETVEEVTEEPATRLPQLPSEQTLLHELSHDAQALHRMLVSAGEEAAVRHGKGYRILEFDEELPPPIRDAADELWNNGYDVTTSHRAWGNSVQLRGVTVAQR